MESLNTGKDAYPRLFFISILFVSCFTHFHYIPSFLNWDYIKIKREIAEIELESLVQAEDVEVEVNHLNIWKRFENATKMEQNKITIRLQHAGKDNDNCNNQLHPIITTSELFQIENDHNLQEHGIISLLILFYHKPVDHTFFEWVIVSLYVLSVGMLINESIYGNNYNSFINWYFGTCFFTGLLIIHEIVQMFSISVPCRRASHFRPGLELNLIHIMIKMIRFHFYINMES